MKSILLYSSRAALTASCAFAACSPKADKKDDGTNGAGNSSAGGDGSTSSAGKQSTSSGGETGASAGGETVKR